MEIIKAENRYFDGLYDYTLEDGDKKLHIDYSGALDTHWLMEDGRHLKPRESAEFVFEITKADYEIYELFDNLYNEVVSGYPYGMDEDFKNTQEYEKLVDEDKNIAWISDDGPEEYADRVIISKEKDSIKLRFIRNSLTDVFELKPSWCISVRFRNSGSRYNYFCTSFQNLYNQMQKINPDLEYHQYHIEEYEYLERMNKKVK